MHLRLYPAADIHVHVHLHYTVVLLCTYFLAIASHPPTHTVPYTPHPHPHTHTPPLTEPVPWRTAGTVSSLAVSCSLIPTYSQQVAGAYSQSVLIV